MEPASAAGHGNPTRASSERRGSDTIQGRKVSVSSERSTSRFMTYLHGTCRKCGHWHDGTRQRFFPHPMRHTSIRCEHCAKKMFGMGRRSTHTSLMSQETTVSWASASPSPRRTAISCSNDDQSISPRQSIPIPAATSYTSPRTVKPPEHPAANQRVPAEESKSTTEDTSNNAKSAISTHVKDVDQNTYSVDVSGTDGRSSGRRMRLFSKAAQRFGRHVLRIDVEVTSSARKTTAITGSLGKRSSVASVAKHSTSRRCRTVDQSETIPLEEDDRKEGEVLSESPTLRNSARIDLPDGLQDDDADVERRKNDPERLQRIKALRRMATRNAARSACQCTSSCDCKDVPESPDSMLDSRHSDNMPSSTSSSRTTSQSTDGSAASRTPIAVMIHRVGAHVSSSSIQDAIRGGRRRSRLSRLSSVVATSDDGSNSRPGSSGLASRSNQRRNMPAVGTEQHIALQHRRSPSTGSMEQMVLIEDERRFTAEPDRMSEHGERPPILRLSTNVGGLLNATGSIPHGVEETSTDGQESAGDGGITPTQSQMDAEAASRLEAGTRGIGHDVV